MALPGGKTWVTMRGTDHQHDKLFSYVCPDSRVPADHPLRTIRRVTDSALTALSPKFAVLYSAIGRPSIPPEKLLRALLLQAFYFIRSERQLMEQLNCKRRLMTTFPTGGVVVKSSWHGRSCICFGD
jgi:transposase